MAIRGLKIARFTHFLDNNSQRAHTYVHTADAMNCAKSAEVKYESVK